LICIASSLSSGISAFNTTGSQMGAVNTKRMLPTIIAIEYDTFKIFVQSLDTIPPKFI
jgi:hypothetical protein